MDPNRWKTVNTIFHAALEVHPSERNEFVRSASHGNAELQSEVEALLKADQEAGSYLESPLIPSEPHLSVDAALLQPGEVLSGRFRILRHLAEGGMGQVFEAFDSELGVRVALKVIRPEIASDSRAIARFRQEVRLARSISHTNVCRTFDLERDVVIDAVQNVKREVVFLTMEFLNGETLSERIHREGALPEHLALAVARQIALGVDTAHAHGIIHRDLKPGNVMLVPSGSPSLELRAVITDFGLARGAAGSDDNPSSVSQFQGWPVGTLAYMPPEQLQGNLVTPAADTYSFGLILYEMITARRAFPSDDFLKGIEQRVSGFVLPATRSESKLPPQWAKAIEWCLRSSPSERPAFASEAIAVLEGGREPAKASGKKRTHRDFPAKLWWMLPVAGTLVATAWYLYRSPKSLHISEYAQLTHDGRRKHLAGTDGSRIYFTYDGSALEQVPIAGGEVSSVRLAAPAAVFHPLDISPNGSHVLISVGPFQPPVRQSSYWNVPLDGGHANYLTDGDGGTGSFSPDGKSMLYIDLHGDLRQVGIDGTGDRKIASIGPATDWARWSPDNKRISLTERNTLFEILRDGSGFHPMLPNWHSSDPQCCGLWTPDGNTFLFMHDSLPGGQIWAIDQSSHLLRHPSPDPIQLTSQPLNWDPPIPGRDGKHIYAVGRNDHAELNRLDLGTGQFQPYLGGIPGEFLSFSPDGKWIAYVGYPDSDVWKANRDGSHPVRIRDGHDFPMFPRWSPDGKRILIREAGGAYVLPADGGTPEKLSTDGNEGIADWSPDGQRIVMEGGNPSDATNLFYSAIRLIRILDLHSRQITPIPGSAGLWWPRWSPDGRYIATLAWQQPGIRIFDLQTQKWSIVAPGLNAAFPSFSHQGDFVYFLSSSGDQAVYRVNARGGKPERIVTLKPGTWTGMHGPSLVLDPTDAPLLLRDSGSSDIYDLTLER